jgi:hypothetical protein
MAEGSGPLALNPCGIRESIHAASLPLAFALHLHRPFVDFIGNFHLTRPYFGPKFEPRLQKALDLLGF